jgi:hypothetical protein
MSSHEACFGVQVTLIRGCAAIQARVGPGGVRRPVVHDQGNVQARINALVQAVQEAGEGDRVVAGDRLGDHLPGGDVQRGDDGDFGINIL